MDIDSHALSVTALVNSRQAASYLRCSPQWLAVLRMQGRGPCYHKHGSWIRYSLTDLAAWAERHRVATSSESAT